ncbi:hypothetical protein J7J08_13045 [Stenotrophomonas sp. ISL-67]|uniref:hypothetical protein n=1 Tax=Stenotrophomonas sp. ISL-67 TaxID=2819171 RepID=UPI001BE77255|nr:hypothetical protein [Stenotrophomonas sp. ISL-67]MBT2768565.1 hypothetical protein [Stenotrophomonas sp. ISL-67]
MSKLIADFHRDPNGKLRRRYYCVNEDGELNHAVTMTLLKLIAESMIPSDGELEALLAMVERGEYVSPNPCLPDWSVNDKCIWFGPPV